VMGSGGTSSLIAIADTPTRAIATTGANANSIPIQKRNGVVQVLTTGVNEVAESPKSLFLYPNEPNPAMDFFHIKFYLNQSEDLTGYLMDMTGQTVHTFRQQFASGTHRIPIPIQLGLEREWTNTTTCAPDNSLTDFGFRNVDFGIWISECGFRNIEIR
jgi:hypothetical protein